MSTQWKVFVQSGYAPNVETTAYTSPGATRSSIDKMTATNVSGATAQITVKLVPSGGAAGTDNVIVQQKSLLAGESYTFPEIVGHTLEPGDFISLLASAASAIVVRAGGRQATA